MTDRELMQQALDALEKDCDWDVRSDAANALRAWLAQPECVCGEPDTSGVHRKDGPCYVQPEQEPVAWKDAPSKIYLQVCEENDCDQPFDSHIEVSWCQDKINDSDIPYVRADTTPPQREWQGLTDEELGVYSDKMEAFARAIEAKLREKNA